MSIDFNDINQIPDMRQSDISFGAGYKFMPKDSEVPLVDEKWTLLFNHCFYGTIPEGQEIEFDMKDEYDRTTGAKYWSFIQSVMKSWGPKHQHKERFCAYLFSCWLKGWNFIPKKTEVLEHTKALE